LSQVTHSGTELGDSVIQWFTGNKLLLSNDKMNVVLFRIKESKTEVLYSSKFLGLIMDEFLDWDEELICRLASACY